MKELESEVLCTESTVKPPPSTGVKKRAPSYTYHPPGYRVNFSFYTQQQSNHQIHFIGECPHNPPPTCLDPLSGPIINEYQ